MKPPIPTASAETPVPGALYTVNDGEGRFRVAKVLVIDEAGVHIRLYKNKFVSRPAGVEISALDLGSIHDPEGLGMGHIPLSYSAFCAWEPSFLVAVGVDEEELEGYRYWQEAQGGYFGGAEH